MCSIIVVEQWEQNTSLFTWPLRKFPFKVCIEQIPLSCYHSIVQDRFLSLKARASQYLLQSKPPEPGNVEDRDSCAASVFVLNLTSFSSMSCKKVGMIPHFPVWSLRKNDLSYWSINTLPWVYSLYTETGVVILKPQSLPSPKGPALFN